MYQPKTGNKCGCRKGVQRDNCSNCEGTGLQIDFKAIRESKEPQHTLTDSRGCAEFCDCAKGVKWTSADVRDVISHSYLSSYTEEIVKAVNILEDHENYIAWVESCLKARIGISTFKEWQDRQKAYHAKAEGK